MDIKRRRHYFGDSVRSATPVTDVLASRVSLTAWLTIVAESMVIFGPMDQVG